MSRPRRLSSSSSLTRTLSRLSSSSSPSTSSTIAVRNEHTRIYTCLIAGALLLLASVTFLQVHLASAPQGSNILASPDNNDNSGRSAIYQRAHTHTHTLSLSLSLSLPVTSIASHILFVLDKRVSLGKEVMCITQSVFLL
jgi:hypothetical protein